MIDWKRELNQEQLEAVTYTGGPLLVLAGAGSGKTRVLTYRVAYFVQELGLPAEKILLMTFTNKAAAEMKERVAKLVGKQPGFAGTFHSLAAKLLRTYGQEIGWQKGFVIYDESDKQDAIKAAMKKLNLDPKLVKPQAVAGAISSAKNEMLTVSDYAAVSRGMFQEKTTEVWREYQKTLMESQAMDFDDLLVQAVVLLQKEEIRERIQRQYEQILVDEYQDTNKAQYLMTKLLVGERQGLTVVGDFSQSIYSWRGADFRNLMYLEKDHPNLKEIKLEQNYRSTQTILDAAYGVIAQNTGHPILKLKATIEGGDKIEVFEARDEKDEANYILNRVLAGDGQQLVLYRTNAQSRPIEEALIRSGVAYTLVGGVRFYERKEVKDVLAYLRLIANPLDAVSWQRIEKVGKRRRAAFENWLNGREVEMSLTTSEYLGQILLATGYLEMFDREDEEDQSRIENVKELSSVAAEFEDLTEFLENVALVQSEAQSGLKEAAKVTLMTMHAAKGLEYDEVIVAGMEEGLFPHSRALMDREQMEEERRLCYVALTRAKRKLALTHARQRLVFGSRNAASPSRFIGEVPAHLVQNNALRAQTTWGMEKVKEMPRPVVDKQVVTRLVADDFAEIDSW